MNYAELEHSTGYLATTWLKILLMLAMPAVILLIEALLTVTPPTAAMVNPNPLWLVTAE